MGGAGEKGGPTPALVGHPCPRGWIVKNPVVRAFQEEQAEQERRKGEAEGSRVGKEKVL